MKNMKTKEIFASALQNHQKNNLDKGKYNHPKKKKKREMEECDCLKTSKCCFNYIICFFYNFLLGVCTGYASEIDLET